MRHGVLRWKPARRRGTRRRIHFVHYFPGGGWLREALGAPAGETRGRPVEVRAQTRAVSKAAGRDFDTFPLAGPRTALTEHLDLHSQCRL